MTKEEFKKMNFKDKVSYLNAKLSEGQTVIKIREDIGIGEKALQRDIKANGYKYDNKSKQYIANTDANIESNTTSNTSSNTQKKDIVVLDENTSPILKESQEVAINFLEENLEVFELIVEKFKANTMSNTTSNTENNTIVVDLIDDKHLKPQAKAFRVNMFVYKEWQEFCENKRFSKQDLLSMAMKEYMEKYK
ncbi:hypothetical protein [Romboutsia sp.]|uniref:hypothetical protein n=1 Tax=Romboutsia sp. TaxID=1965302 RepID=UPI003F3D37E0